MIHGDLKGVRFLSSVVRVAPILPSLLAKANILIDQVGCAKLADFGLLTIISDPKYLLSSSSHTQGGTVRWMSPERIAPDRFGFDDSRPTSASDCYALGMVIYETISGNVPFHKDMDLTVSLKVVEGKRPPRGTKFTDGLWGTLEKCWASKPSNRPMVKEVLRCLEMTPDSSEPPSPGGDEWMDEDSDDLDSLTSSFDGGSVDLFRTFRAFDTVDPFRTVDPFHTVDPFDLFHTVDLFRTVDHTQFSTINSPVDRSLTFP